MNVPADGLPSGWYAKESSRHPGHVYFYHPETGKVQWKLPPPEKLRCSHILLKHAGSRNPTARKGGVGEKVKITRTLEEARDGIAAIIEELTQVGISQFGKIAEERSNCSSARSKGDLGTFGRGKMMPTFEEAAFALQVGEISDVVESPSGVHVILRTA